MLDGIFNEIFRFDAFSYASIAVKFLLYLGMLRCIGIVLSAHVFKTHLSALAPALKRSAILFAAIALVASVLSFSLRGADLTGDISGMTDPEMLEILWQTPVGSALLLRLAGLSLFIICLLIGGVMSAFGFAAGLLALWSFAEIGHVSGSELWWLKIIMFSHLLGVAFWIGILSPLAALARDEGKLNATADLGHRFGQLAAFIVPLLIFAGLILAYFLVGSLGDLFASGYGLTLIVKVILVGALLALAALNKMRFIPAMREGSQGAARHLAKSIRFEWFAIYGVLFVTAVLTSVLAPPN